MNKNVLISVIIPIYNVEIYLDECLNSVINQIYKNLEIILVDDGSTDKSGEICNEFAKKDSRIRVIHQKNAGVSVARNSALDIANGEFITFVDSDDTIEKEHILNMINLLQDDIDIVCVPFSKSVEKFKLKSIEALKYILSEIYIKNKDYYFGWSLWTKLFRADNIKEIRFLEDEKVGEDFSFVWRSFVNSKNIIFGGKKTYNYRISQTSVMQSKFSHKHESLLLVYDRFIEYVKNNNFALLNDAYVLKATGLVMLIRYARKNNQNIDFVKKYSKQLRLLQSEVYKSKMPFIVKFVVFLQSYFSGLLSFRNKIKEKFKK